MADQNASASQIEGLATLLILNDELRKLDNIREFSFFVTNETHRLIPYNICFLWQRKEFVGNTIVMQSGTPEVEVNSPSNQWLKELINKILTLPEAKTILQFSEDDAEHPTIVEHWPESLPSHLLWCPLINKAGVATAGLIFFRNSAFSDVEIKMLRWLLSSYQYTWIVLTKPSMKSHWHRYKEKSFLKWLTVSIIIICLFPVRLSVLGTGTVVPKSPVLINAPMEGVIRSIAVDPGSIVKAGDLLFSMDKIDLESTAEINNKDYLLTEAKLRAVVNEGFSNKSTNSEIPVLQAQLAIDKAHVNYTNTLLARADVKSPINGVVIFDSKEDWVGQPVRTGQRIFVVANPNEVELKIIIPVANMIKLDLGAPGKFFLYGKLSPLSVKVKTLGYNAKQQPNRILAYHLRADFTSQRHPPTIGSQGTVKIYGRHVPFIYYLLRKPLQTFRQTLGI